MGLEQRRLTKEPRLTGTTATDDQDVFVSGKLRLFGTARHGQTFRHGHGDVLKEIRVYVRGNVRSIAPTGAAVFHAVPVLLGVLASQIYGHTYHNGTSNTQQQIRGVEAGQHIGKGSRKALRNGNEPGGKIFAGRQTKGLGCFVAEIRNDGIGNIGKDQLF